MKTKKSHPLRVRGLKQAVFEKYMVWAESHPLRVRGLKPAAVNTQVFLAESHPLRVRGLKLERPDRRHTMLDVAPFTGAWIETTVSLVSSVGAVSRTLYGCVD